jgi:hypothetical protein
VRCWLDVCLVLSACVQGINVCCSCVQPAPEPGRWSAVQVGCRLIRRRAAVSLVVFGLACASIFHAIARFYL